MTLKEFRIKHSELIEHYQHIEYNLEGLYSSLSEDKTFLDGMREVEKDTIRKLVGKICVLQKELGIVVLDDQECEQIELICKRRNYWCHECYIKMVFDRKTGSPRESYTKELIDDTQFAARIRKELFDKKLPYLTNKFHTEVSHAIN